MLPEQALSFGFAGCKDEGRMVLNRLLEAGFAPRFICVLDELPCAEQQRFEQFAEAVGAKFFVSRDLCDRTNELQALDLLLTCRFNLLDESVFAAPRLGSINIHQSLLPAYRGVHPTSWALIRGERRTGVSIHRIDDGIDTGDVLAQRVVDIDDDDDLLSLNRKLATASGDLVVEFWCDLQRHGRLPPPLKRAHPAPDFYARRREPGDGWIDWHASSTDIRNLVRALPEPLPPSFSRRACGQTVPVRKTRALPAPGTVLAQTTEGCYVVVNGDSVSLIETDARLNIGERLE